MKIKIQLPTAEQIIKSKGLDPGGDVQAFHTKNVLGRLERYMHFNTGATHKITVLQTDIRKPEIITDVPYGKYLFYGKKMVNAKTGKGPALIPGVGYRYKKGTILKPTEENLNFRKPAGPHWDRALSVAEGKAMAADLQRYIDRKTKK